MNYFILAIFLSAASFGVVNLLGIYNRRRAPRASIIAHGVLVLVGILILISYLVAHKISLLPLYIFLLAASGGIYILYNDINQRRFPKWLGFIHGAIAIFGIIAMAILIF